MSGLLFLLGCPSPEPTVEIRPASPVQGRDALFCVTEASEVTWRVDGVAVSGDGDGRSIAAERTREGREWTCTATERDVSVSTSVTAEPLASNVLLFLLDDIGVDKIGVYDQLDDAPPQTPVIDGLAADGIRFHRAWSAPVCTPTRATVLTGRYGRRVGLGRIIDQEAPNHILAYEETFIPEMLRYAPEPVAASMTGKWHLAWIRPRYLDHPSAGAGFEYHSGSMDNLGRAVVPDGDPRGYFHWENNVNGSLIYRDRYATEFTVEQAVGLTQNMPEPWFLYVPFNGAHIPYHTPPDDYVYTPPADESSPELFRAMVESIDIAIGNVLDGMEPDVRARTTVFVVGDNGTAVASTLPELEFAKGSLLESGVRVPFIVQGHGVEQTGVSDTMVHTADLFDTVAAIMGADLEAMDAEPGALPRDSQSFLPVLADLDAPGRDTLYSEWFDPNGPPPYDQDWRTVTDGRFKLLVLSNTEESIQLLYDLESDPDELNDLLEAPLSAEAAAAQSDLQARLDALEADLIYDSPLGDL